MQVLVVDVGVVVTEGVVEMTIVVVVVVAEEWKLVLGTGTAHRKWSVYMNCILMTRVVHVLIL